MPGTVIFCASEGSFGGDEMANTGVGAVEFTDIIGRNSRVLFVVIRGTLTWYATVSIQNLAVMTAAWALGVPLAPSGGRVVIVACVPARNEMLAVPPPFIVASLGTVAPVETSKVMVSRMFRPWMARCRTKLGFLMMSVVMVPAAINLCESVSCVHRGTGRLLVKYLRSKVLRDSWRVDLVCILRCERNFVIDISNGERCGVEDRKGGYFRLAT